MFTYSAKSTIKRYAEFISFEDFTSFLIKCFLTATSGTKPIIVSLGMFIFSCTKERKEEVPLSMAIGNWELMHECFPNHSRRGTARIKSDKETGEEGKKRGEYGRKQSGQE